MPLRYPGIESYRNAGRKTGQIARTAAGMYANASIDADPLYSNPPTGDSAGAENPNSVARYPSYKQPSTFQRIFAPEASANIDRMNFQSQFAQAENAQQLSNAKSIAEHQANLNAVVNKAIRDGRLTPEEGNIFRDYYAQKVLGDASADATMSQVRSNTFAQNPSRLAAGILADVDKQGIVNRNTAASTRHTDTLSDINQISMPYLDTQHQLGIDTQRQALERDKQMLPGDVMQRGIIRLQPGEVTGNVPTTIDGRAINYLYNFPGSRQEEESVPFTNPATGKPIEGMFTTRKLPAQPPGLFNTTIPGLGESTPLMPRSRNSPPAVVEEDSQYIYRTNPVTGVRERKLKTQR